MRTSLRRMIHLNEHRHIKASSPKNPIIRLADTLSEPMHPTTPIPSYPPNPSWTGSTPDGAPSPESSAGEYIVRKSGISEISKPATGTCAPCSGRLFFITQNGRLSQIFFVYLRGLQSIWNRYSIRPARASWIGGRSGE